MTCERRYVVGDDVDADVLVAELWYPRNRPTRVVEINLIDVRAADGIRVEYDFDRDGWVIKQASTFSWDDDDDTDCDMDWQEVAFVEAWARKKPGVVP